MDEQTLNILLECPVCLNILNESSRVLPCQHTFCSECLEDILGRRGSLMCPECRTVVTTSIEHLPRNILLMRLLEGLKYRRNSNAHLELDEKPVETEQRYSKSTPCTPDYSSNSPSFAFLFPYQPQRRSSIESLETRTPTVSSGVSGSETHQSPSRAAAATLHRRTSAVFIVPQPPEAEPGRRLRQSRTTTDLASLSLSPPLELPGHSVADRSQPLPVPTISLTEAVSPNQSPATAQLPTIQTDSSLFAQPNWRQSPRNRSLPSNPVLIDPGAREAAARRVAAGTRTVSHESRTTASETGPSYRAWMPNPIGEQLDQHRGPVMELVFSNQPSRSGSQRAFNARGQEKPAAIQLQATIPAGRSSKESRSFIKNLFGGNKSQQPSTQLVAHKLTNLSSLEQDKQGVWQQADLNRPSKVCTTTTFRSAATRYSAANSKPANINFECYRCVTPYNRRNNYELDLHLNDLLYVHQKHSDGWMKATHERTGRNGLIPIAFVERLHSNTGVSSS